MKKLLSHRFCYIICLAILLGMHSCNCNNTTTEEPPAQETPPTRKGYWHTGTPTKILKITAYPQNTYKKELYERPYQIYRVKHDGSCGFRSFIPILFHEILGTGKLDQWLTYIENIIYKPAQNIITQVNDWTDTKAGIGVNYTDNTASSKLCEAFKNLLQKLNTESAIRPLQEEEIKLSVDFLRQCVFMHLVITKYPEDEQDKTAAARELKEELKQAATMRTGGLVNFWANDSDFLIFNIPYIIMFDKDRWLGTMGEVHNILYYFPNNGITVMWQDGYSTMGKDPNGQKKLIEKPEDLPQADVMMYHHDGIFFEYIIFKRDEQP